MMKAYETFGYYLNRYFTAYLPGQRGLSTNSILSYRDTFSLFVKFLKTEKNLVPENLGMNFLTKQLILDFLEWLESERKYSRSSRNQRFVILRSFCRWLASENPQYLKLSEEIYEVKLKKAPKPTVKYLPVEATKCLLEQPDTSTNKGIRDLTFIAFMYDTGARVSEVIALKFKDIRFSPPPIVTITGKGNKSRIVPLSPQTVNYFKTYVLRFNINIQESQESYVFTNRSGCQLTRAGAKYILDSYVASAREVNPSILPEKVTPHTLRHTKAMHLLQAGTNIVYIRDILGHSDLNTTERYARADTSMKREALEKAEISMPELKPATESPLDKLIEENGIEADMSYWLKNFGK